MASEKEGMPTADIKHEVAGRSVGLPSNAEAVNDSPTDKNNLKSAKETETYNNLYEISPEQE